MTKNIVPQNRHKTGFCGPSPDVGKATQFKPGNSGNPGGRPKSKPITERYLKRLRELVPNNPKKRTFLELLVDAIFGEALKGKVQAAAEITDRIEGLSHPTKEDFSAEQIDVRIITLGILSLATRRKRTSHARLPRHRD